MLLRDYVLEDICSAILTYSDSKFVDQAKSIHSLINWRLLDTFKAIDTYSSSAFLPNSAATKPLKTYAYFYKEAVLWDRMYRFAGVSEVAKTLSDYQYGFSAVSYLSRKYLGLVDAMSGSKQLSYSYFQGTNYSTHSL
jgi:hypothetical protein